MRIQTDYQRVYNDEEIRRVENPVELPLGDLQKLGKEETITMHSCVQGWTGIAEWGVVPINKIVELVNPHSDVTTIAFYSFGEG